MKRAAKITLIASTSLIGAVALTIGAAFSILGIRTHAIDVPYSYVLAEHKIVSSRLDVPLVKQEISCGYAIIEMLSDYYGQKVSEDELYARNGNRITTSSTGGFVDEINKNIPNRLFSSHDYVPNDELLLRISQSLEKGHPVAVEWAAKLDEEWTLHWSLVTGMDQEQVYVNNPYGYKEEISYDEFISRTTFRAFEGMNIGFQFGFAFGLFGKNTVILSSLA